MEGNQSNKNKISFLPAKINVSRVIRIEASKKILPRPSFKTVTFAYLVIMWVFLDVNTGTLSTTCLK